MSVKICYLAPWEADAPDCLRHRHLSVKKALALTDAGCVRWVGPRRIVQVRDYAWQPRASSGFLVMQMIPDRARS